jgi:hypothetical protein
VAFEETIHDTETVSSKYTAKGDRWEVWVIPDDGIEIGGAAKASINVSNTPPTGVINEPAKSIYNYSEEVSLIATVDDVDAGDPGNLTFFWESSKDGQLMDGSAPVDGSITTEIVAELTSGDHEIMLTISDGESSTMLSVNITVKSGRADVNDDDTNSIAGVDYPTFGILIAAIVGVVVILIVLLILKKRRESEMELDDMVDDPNAAPGSSAALYGSEFTEDALDRKIEAGGQPPPQGAVEGGPAGPPLAGGPPALPPGGGPPPGGPPGAPPQ